MLAQSFGALYTCEAATDYDQSTGCHEHLPLPISDLYQTNGSNSQNFRYEAGWQAPLDGAFAQRIATINFLFDKFTVEGLDAVLFFVIALLLGNRYEPEALHALAIDLG